MTTLAELTRRYEALAAEPQTPQARPSDTRPSCAQCGCYGPVGDDGLCHSCRTYAQRQQDRIDDCRAASAADDALARGAQGSSTWCHRCGGPVADGSGVCGEC